MANRTVTSALERPAGRSEKEGQSNMEYWAIWYPKAAATGLLLGRGLLDRTDNLLLHAAPDVITVEVLDIEGRRIAYGKDLERTQVSPMCHLRRDGSRIVREDFWPSDAVGCRSCSPEARSGNWSAGGTPKTRKSGAGESNSTTPPAQPSATRWPASLRSP